MEKTFALRGGAGYTALLGPEGLRLSRSPEGDGPAALTLIGADLRAEVHGFEASRSFTHYLFGNSPTRWRTNVPHYKRIQFTGIYPGIDISYHSANKVLEFDFFVKPAADPSRIGLFFPEAKQVLLEESGDLLIDRGSNLIRLHRPTCYQPSSGQKLPIPCSFVLEENFVAFRVGHYDRSRSLIIDPTVDYVTRVGGSELDSPADIAVTPDGSVVVVGSTWSTDFYTRGAVQSDSRASGPLSRDLFVFKLSPDGQDVLFSTYFGGSGDDRAGSVTLDPDGNIFLVGRTTSVDYPTTLGVVRPAKDTLSSVPEGFVTKLSADGSNVLISTFLGTMSEGPALDDAAGRFGGIGLDAAGNVFVAASVAGTDLYRYPWFPTPKRPFNLPISGNSDIVVMKLDPLVSRVLYSTYLGGTVDDQLRAMEADAMGNLYLAGVTTSADFPIQIPLGAEQGLAGVSAGVVVKLSPAGDLLASSYLAKAQGVQGQTLIQALTLDASGHVYLTGFSQDPNFPLQNPFQTEGNGFVTKLNNSLTTILYSTRTYGFPFDIAVDSSQRVFLTGSNLAVFRTGTNAFSEYSGSASLAAIDASGQSFLYATGLGDLSDRRLILAADAVGNAFIAGLVDNDKNAAPLEIEATPNPFGPLNPPFRRMPGLFVARIAPQNPVPIIDAVSPAIFTVGQPVFPRPPYNTVTLHGRGFVTGGSVQVGDRPRAGKVDYKTVEFTVDKSDLSRPRVVPVRLSAPPPGGGVSSARSLLVLNPTPTIREIWPAGAVKQAGALELAIVGAGFTPDATVRFGSVELRPRVINELELEVTLPAGSIAAPGLVPVTVSLPSPGGGASPPVMFPVGSAGAAPAQRLAVVNPGYAAAGLPAATTTIYGTGFDSSCSAFVNGQKRATTFVDLETMTARFLSQDLVEPGTIELSVSCTSTGSVASGPVPFGVSLGIGARDIAFDRTRSRLYATLGPDAPSGSSIAIINPKTKKIEGHIPVGPEPRELAITDNDRYLYVGVDGESAIKRIDLASGSIAGVIPLGMHESEGPYKTLEIEAQPGSDDVFIAVRFAERVFPTRDIMAFRGAELIGIGPHDGGTFDELGFAGPNRIYGVLRGQLNEWSLSANTFDLVRTNRDLPSQGGSGEIVQWNDLLFLRGGVLVDAISLKYYGTLPNAYGAVVPVISSGRIVSHSQITGPNGYFLSVHDPRDFHLVAAKQTISSYAQKITPSGDRELAALNEGNIFFLESPVDLRGPWFTRDSVTNSASYRPGPITSGEFLSIFGVDLAEGVHLTADRNLPEDLGDTKVRFTDSADQSKYARLHLISPEQINLVVPDGLAAGPATLTLERSGLPLHTIVLQVRPAAPGLFGFKTAADDVAAAEVAWLENGLLTFHPVFRCAGAGICEPEPFSLGNGAILVLFATGLGQSPSEVRVEIGGLPAEILYAGPQGQYPGLDQINVGIPPELAGRGKVAIRAILGNQETNVVTVWIH